jgi:hypothetical protein
VLVKACNGIALPFYLHLDKMKKTPSPICSCPKKDVQTARHLLTECSLFSNEQLAVFQTLFPTLVLKYHINTVSITGFLRSKFHTLQEQD